jgi:phenylpropionate dioxygenase-like ring-hydroxylating dioxygenase large terminal subunit
VMHLPFTHRTTIGRGGRTLVDGPLVEWLDGDRLRFHVFNRVDDGTPPRKPGELEPGAGAVHLDLQLPNVWQNHISDSLRVVAAFAPVDEESTVIYLRTYQKTVLVPGLREVYEWLLQGFNRVVLGQDRRVVLTQRPIKTALKMVESLVQGDLPIVEYRRRRQELLDARDSVPLEGP